MNLEPPPKIHRHLSIDSNQISRPASAVSMDTETQELDSNNSSSVVSWITWFCSLPGHEFLSQVPESWIEDDFNMTGLSSMVPMYSLALDTILDLESDESSEEIDDSMGPEAKKRLIESSAETLYSLIHARYITTRSELSSFKDRFIKGEFGQCPRVGCHDSNILPCGLSDVPSRETLKFYCPRCMDIYHPRQPKYQSIDGCFFGSTFPHLFFLTFPECLPSLGDFQLNGKVVERYEVYEAKIYGFRVSCWAKNGPVMKWLRDRERN